MKDHGHRLAPVPGHDPGVSLLAQLCPYVRHCGDARRPAWRIGERRLLDYLLVGIADGEGQFSVGECSFAVRTGDVVWIPPNTPHVMEGFAPGMCCPYVHFDLAYRPSHSHWDFSIPAGMQLDELKPLMHPPIEDARLTALTGLQRGPGNRRVIDLVREICSEAARGRAFASLRMSGLLLHIVGELLADRHGSGGQFAEHRPLLEEAERWMADHCHEAVRMQELAAMCGLSVSRFRTVFQEFAGRSPREHLRRLRMRRAQQLMLGSDLTLGAVAERCGFADVHAFSRAFRAEMGMSPGQWRCYGQPAVRVEGRAVPYSGAAPALVWTEAP